MTDRNPIRRLALLTQPLRCGALLACALIVLSTAPASLAREGEPPVSFRKSATPLTEIALRTMPAVDVERLRSEDAIAEQAPTPQPTRFAAPIPVAFDLETSGTWENLDDGSRLWRLRIASPGALSLNLGLQRFDIPQGARLWLYDSRGLRVEGPYTSADAARDGSLWTPLLLDDEVTLELHLPAGTAEARVEVSQVSHGYRFFGEVPGKQGACNIDVVCSQADPYRDQVRAVARYTRSGAFLCTGQLLNNTSGNFRPLFLTAEHCGITSGNASSVVVYWNYEAPTCGQLSGGSLDDNQSGSTLLADYEPSDFALIELDAAPSEASNVYYAGWDVSGSTPQSVVGIHHPRGDEKAIAIEGDPLVSVDIGTGGQTHWQVNAWDEGTTEGGSSGSCIFDQATKRCVGKLTGGFASCTNPTGLDVYGKLSVSWTGGGTAASRLSDWLDPTASGATVLDGANPGGVGPACVTDNDTLCLNNNRFKVEVMWDTGDDTGPAIVVPGGTGDSSNFWFFSANNWEMLFKVLNGCGINNHYWVFFAATTDVGFTATVTDTQTNEVKVYTNALGQAANAITDTSAFATCP
ncbi:MAG: hypothetical protein AAF657_23900 [Acidobacteriota bacterium]